MSDEDENRQDENERPRRWATAEQVARRDLIRQRIRDRNARRAYRRDLKERMKIVCPDEDEEKEGE